METIKKRRAGRPARDLRPGERVPMSFRVPPALKYRMDQAAAESGRSVAHEIEIRLDQSFRDEEAFKAAVARMYGRQAAGVILVLARAMCLAGRESLRSRDGHEADWLRDPWAYDQAARAANTVLDAYRPDGEIVLPAPEPPIASDTREQNAAYAESVRNPGPSWAAGVLATVVEKQNRETWVVEIRDLLGDLADRDVRETGQ